MAAAGISKEQRITLFHLFIESEVAKAQKQWKSPEILC